MGRSGDRATSEEDDGVPVTRECGPPPEPGVSRAVDSRCDALRDPPIIRCRFVRPQPKSNQNLRVAEVEDSVSNLLRKHDIHQRKSLPANAQIRLVEHLAPVVLDHLTDGVLG
jgi:hypothetical protein